MFRGFSTISYFTDDVPAAAQWYAEVLGVEPYFVRPVDGPPAYVEFRVGDLQAELGLVDRRYAPHSDTTGGAVMYWHVDDLDATLARLLDLGATLHQPRIERGPGFVTASVFDPFGNIVGIMYNEHYRSMVGDLGQVAG